MPHQNNKILVYASSAVEGVNIQTQEIYSSSSETSNGVKTGIANGDNFNKLAKQTSLMSSTLAQFMAERLNNKVIDDTLSVENLSSYLNDSILDIVKGTQTPGIIVIDKTNTAITSFNQINETGVYWIYKSLTDGPFDDDEDYICNLLVSNFEFNTTANETKKATIKVVNSTVPPDYEVGGKTYVLINYEDITDPTWDEINPLNLEYARTSSMQNITGSDAEKLLLILYDNSNNKTGFGNWDFFISEVIKYKNLIQNKSQEIGNVNLNNLPEGIFHFNNPINFNDTAIVGAPQGYTQNTEFTVITTKVDSGYGDCRQQIIYKGSIFGSDTYIRKEIKQNNSDPFSWSNWELYEFKVKTATTLAASDSNVLMLDSDKNLVKRSIESLKGVFGQKQDNKTWTVYTQQEMNTFTSNFTFNIKVGAYHISEENFDGKIYKHMEIRAFVDVNGPDTDSYFYLGFPYPQELQNFHLFEYKEDIRNLPLYPRAYMTSTNKDESGAIYYGNRQFRMETNVVKNNIRYIVLSIGFWNKANSNLNIIIDGYIDERPKLPTPTSIAVTSILGSSPTITFNV